MKKNISLFAAVLAAVCCMQVSCGSETGTPAINDTKTTDNTPQTEAVTEAPLPSYDAGGRTYDGYTFHMLSFDPEVNQWTGIPSDLTNDGAVGEILNDSVYLRNQKTEEALDIKLESTLMYPDKLNSALRSSVMSGSNDYDVAFPVGINVVDLVNGQLLADLYSVEGLDCSAPWWDAASVDAFTLDGKLLAAISDITYFDKLATFVVYFNSVMASNLDLGDLYSMVDSGAWTFDKMLTISKGVSQDLNGDGKYDMNDSFGISSQNDAAYVFLNSANEFYCTKDQSGKLQFTLTSSSAMDVMERVYSLMADKQQFFNRQSFSKVPTLAETIAMFAENRSLFMIRPMQSLFAMRDVTSDFGLLPVPKFSESQDKYAAAINPWAATFLTIPRSYENGQRTADIIQTLACNSMNIVKEPFYTFVLGEKLLRDTRSGEMLDIAFSSRVYDIGLIWNVGQFRDKLIVNNYAGKFASTLEKYEKPVATDIEKLYATLAELD